MTRIMFVCLGNICRSPMAEFVMKKLAAEAGLREAFFIASAATSTDEIDADGTGNPVYPPARAELAKHGIGCEGKRAVQLLAADYEKYDLFIGMDTSNIRDMTRILGGDPQKKIHKLCEFSGTGKDVADPWFYGNFDKTYEDVLAGCRGILQKYGNRSNKKEKRSMQSFFELARNRYSVRAYKNTPVEEEKLQKILEAGLLAPTAKNCQPQKIYVVKSEENRKKLAQVTPYTFHAPVILVVCYDEEKACKGKVTPDYDFGNTDAAIVCTHMMLEAADLGIGSCWVGWFEENEVRSALGIPENIRVCELMPLGYAADNAAPAPLHTMSRRLEDVTEEI